MDNCPSDGYAAGEATVGRKYHPQQFRRSKIEQSSRKPVATFAYSKRHAVVAQCHDSGHTSLPINQLQKLLVEGVTAGQIQWAKNWVILTEPFRAKGFSTLISGSSKSSSSHSSVSKTTAKSSGYSGTLVGVTRGVDGVKLGTDCHYSTPVGSFTVSSSGWNDCDKTHPAPRSGGFGR